MKDIEYIKDEYKPHIDPVSWFNNNRIDFVKELLTDDLGIEFDDKDILHYDKTRSIMHKNGLFYFKGEIKKYPSNDGLSSFQVYNFLKHKNNVYSAIITIQTTMMGHDNPFARIGCQYFKQILKPDRYKIDREELRPWLKDTLRDDFGKEFINKIKRFDDFIIEPDNVNYKRIIESNFGVYYNLYAKFSHIPKIGKWGWTERFLRHVFGEQYEMGLIYLQVLYMYPKQVLPILVLVSKTRQTGKSTFLEWLSLIFGSNMVVINPEDIASQFNGAYANKNIIAIEEALVDKRSSVEKIKAISTLKEISVNEKHVSHYKIPFFGKIIINTNNEDDFARIDEEEIRFWIRKLGDIPKENENHNIVNDLKNEIPFFLYYLSSLPIPDFSRSRMVFTADEIITDELLMVKKESLPSLYKNLMILIADYFNENTGVDEFYASLKEVKDKWYYNNSQIQVDYIKKILKVNFKKSPTDKIIRYFNVLNGESKTGKPYLFKRSEFDSTIIESICLGDLESEKDEMPF